MPRRFAALIRHAKYHQRNNVPSAHQPFDLSEEGNCEAGAAAKLVHGLSQELDAELHPVVDTSQMLRTWRTAQILTARLPQKNFTLESFEDLAERGVGAAANLTLTEIQLIVDGDPRYDSLPEGWKSDSNFVLPFQGAESLMQSGERVARHIQNRMRQISPENNVIKLFVGHGASFRHAAYVLGILEFKDIRTLSMHHARPVVFELSSNCKWTHVAGNWKIRASGQPILD